MEIKKAKEMGFCFGVRRAVKLLQEAAYKYNGVETLGAVVHNQQVVNSLAQLGVRVVETPEQLGGGIVAIPSHGVEPQVMGRLQGRGVRIIDATCPIVRKAQMAARDLAKGDFWVIVFGDAEHPEVKGILGWAGEKGVAALDVEAAWRIDKLPRRLGVLSQTTQSTTHFTHFVNELSASLLPKIEELRIINTLCQATIKRQAAALKLAREVDLMIVVGGRNSANTHRLAEICSSTGVEAHHIETAAEIDVSWLKGKKRLGITAGASTPDKVIQEVILKLEEMGGTHV